MIELIGKQAPYLLLGLGISVLLTITTVSLGIIVGFGLAIAELYGNKFVSFIAQIVGGLLRSVPEIILLFAFYFGVSQAYNLTPFVAATLALGLRSGAYQAQIYLSALIAVPSAQITAGRAIGMSAISTFLHIRVSQALRHLISPWSNELATAFKLTSLAYLIGVVDLMRQGKYLIGITRGNVLEILCFIAIVYFAINWLMNHGLRRLQKRLLVPGFQTDGAGEMS